MHYMFCTCNIDYLLMYHVYDLSSNKVLFCFVNFSRSVTTVAKWKTILCQLFSLKINSQLPNTRDLQLSRQQITKRRISAGTEIEILSLLLLIMTHILYQLSFIRSCPWITQYRKYPKYIEAYQRIFYCKSNLCVCVCMCVCVIVHGLIDV